MQIILQLLMQNIRKSSVAAFDPHCSALRTCGQYPNLKRAYVGTFTKTYLHKQIHLGKPTCENSWQIRR